MFIEITTPANPLRIENTLRPCKRGEKTFSPEAARQILTMTNNKKNIHDMLQLIATLPKDQQAKYKDIVLAVFDHREQPTDTVILAKKLAIANGYEDELNQTINHDPTTDEQDGIIYASAVNQIAGYICTRESPDKYKFSANVTIYCANDEVYLTNIDLCSIKNLKFRAGSKINLIKCHNLPADLDVSMCKEVNLHFIDLSSIKNLKFKEGRDVYLDLCDNLPADLDVSMCDYVNLCTADLSPVKNLKFKEGSHVALGFCSNLPADLDVSMCKEVNLSKTDLAPIKKLTFRAESNVYLTNCKNLPRDLDVSMCKKIYLFNADISKVKNLKFKNKAQKEESKVIIPDEWQGKIIYTDEQPMTAIYLNKNISR